MPMTTMARVLDMASAFGTVGVTAADVEEMIEKGHGPVSAALSRAARQGRLVRLSERREGFGVYVVPDCVNGREKARTRRGVGEYDRLRGEARAALRAALIRQSGFYDAGGKVEDDPFIEVVAHLWNVVDTNRAK